eukprot:CAMPEP_0174258752 /NCGR_PEP_ID=MMETSP0439-20130205/7691_1 /TAXON_ID=0 /ORGANISM="Stereomyxa ramosa, Strain Chinc5" /LENGTH=195 /DNA_ID=CAMNT_0015342375 /DNA_START=344 /DNA_END=931 /DNA_ORIENTATION=-
MSEWGFLSENNKLEGVISLQSSSPIYAVQKYSLSSDPFSTITLNSSTETVESRVWKQAELDSEKKDVGLSFDHNGDVVLFLCFPYFQQLYYNMELQVVCSDKHTSNSNDDDDDDGGYGANDNNQTINLVTSIVLNILFGVVLVVGVVLCVLASMFLEKKDKWVDKNSPSPTYDEEELSDFSASNFDSSDEDGPSL